MKILFGNSLSAIRSDNTAKFLAMGGSKGLVRASPTGPFGLGWLALTSAGAATLFDVSDWIARRSAIFFAGQRHRNAVRLDYPKLENRKCRPMANSSSGTDKSPALMRRVYSYCKHTLDRL